MEPQFVDFESLARFELAEGVDGRPLFGEGAMINLIEFEPGATSRSTAIRTSSSASSCAVPRSSSSTARITRSAPMQGYVLPGGVEHAARCGPEGALVIDVFQPIREDYRERAGA